MSKLIGISTRVVHDPDYTIEILGGPYSYSQSVREVGGTPVLIPLFEEDLTKHAEAYASKLDALILAGGEDVDPQLYGEVPHEKLGTVSRKRDDFEIALLHAFLKAGKKILGVCRGLQLINVAFGGTLYQDIDSQCDRVASFSHISLEDKWYMLTHKISLEPNTKLAKIFSENEFSVNSIHHQVIKKLGDNLKVSSYSVEEGADKIIESIELASAEHQLIAVQWHPETMWQKEHLGKSEQLKFFEFLL